MPPTPLLVAQTEDNLRTACANNGAVKKAADRFAASSKTSVDASLELARTAQRGDNVVDIKTGDLTNRFAAYRA